MKWPIRRRQPKNGADVPPEIQEYYRSEKRERVSVAWMLALATLVVTVLLALGIFYGGRWAYRTLFDNDQGITPAEQAPQQEQVPPPGRENVPGAVEQPAALPGVTPTAPQTGLTLPETGSSSDF